MIKLEKVEKYYNRGKNNQIHVIDNTSMTLPDRGIVCLLGPSGCGKTTLLNAMGGLDKVDLGRIEIDNDRITNCSANKIDTVRNAKIGYIFQNFNLLDDRTVYENVAIALRMVGVTSEKTIKERVNYCLEQVGIYQFRNRKAAALSGGQRQRVAIARAIVKNPKIIIADEPTGNLDSVNSLEIMNIIKKISAARLVVLVTHEKKLAEFYSDHIAEIQDGKIVRAYNNDSSRYLDYQLENRIYLKDMPVEKDFCVSDIAVRYFSEDDRPVDIKLVVKGSNLYIDTGGKFNVVDETSNIELINDHYKAMDTSIYEDNDFRYDAYLPEDFKARYTSVYGIGNMFVNGWRNLVGFRKFKKFLLVGFVFAAMFAFLAVSNTFGIFDVQPKDYRTTNGNYVTVSNPNRTKEAMDVVESLDAVDYVIPGNTRKSVTLPLDDYLQTSYATASMEVSIAHSASLTNDDLICGNLPEDKRGVVLDRLVAEKVMKDTNAKEVGLSSVEKFVGRKIKISNLDDYVISGISDTVSPSMFVDESQVMNILTNADDEGSDFQFAESDEDEDPIRSGKVKDIALSKSKITMKKGSKPNKKYEVIISNQHSYDYKLGSTIKPKMGGHKLKIVGFYESNVYGEDTYYVSSETISADYISKQKVFTAHAPNAVALQSMLETKGITSRINDDRDRNNYINSMKSALKSSLLVAAVLLLISLIEMFLMLRSSFLARIKEVGIMRAIGLKKREIYKMFAGEILVITVVTAIPGILLMYFLLGNIVKITDYLAGMYMITPTIALITLAVVIVFNLIVGLIPVFMTMRKTPAQILARTDI